MPGGQVSDINFITITSKVRNRNYGTHKCGVTEDAKRESTELRNALREGITELRIHGNREWSKKEIPPSANMSH